MKFASDNSSGAHPKVMEALLRANEGYASSYGTDPIMDGVRARIREIFEAPNAAVYLVATGTSANVLSIATYTPPWGAVYCHEAAHIEVDECGAPEFYTGGAKLVTLPGNDAKIDPQALRDVLGPVGPVAVHHVQKAMLSITTATELGTVYSLDEIRELAAIAKAHDLPVHMDGARFANALVSLGCTPAEMTWKSGVDVLSFGGTKNGLLGVEAVVLFDPQKAWEFELRRKRGGHLFSKHRFLSAQMEAYLADDLWLGLARSANAMGAELAKGITEVSGASILHPVDANMVFASWPRSGHRAAQAAGAAYHFWPVDYPMDGPDQEALPARLVCSWSTTSADIQAFLNTLR